MNRISDLQNQDEEDYEPSLQEATVKQIADELGKRYPGVMVAICGPNQQDSELEATRVVWRGGRLQAAGLALLASRRLSV